MKLPLRAVLIGLALLPLCTFAQSGCTNPWACNYDAFALEDDGSCDLDTCAGCTIEAACNYNPDATRDNGSCDFDCITGCTFIQIEGVGLCHHVYNVDPNALIDDGSCVWEPVWCPTDITCDGGIDAADILSVLGHIGTECPTETGISTSTPAPWVVMDFPEAQGYVPGTCNHPQACNYDPNAPDGQLCDWLSCMDCSYAWACDYNPDFEGTYVHCDFTSCRGCTYEVAQNYDPSAIVEDGSCQIFVGNPCPWDRNGDGLIDTADLLQVMGTYGNTCN